MSDAERLRMEGELAYLEANRARVVQPHVDDNASIATLVDTQVALHPNAVMAVFEENETTWADFQALTWRIAQVLAAEGAGPGACLALNMANSTLYLACVVAVARVGAVCALLNTDVTGARLVHCAKAVDADITLADRAALHRIRACAQDYRKTAPNEARVLVFGIDDGDIAAHEKSWIIAGDSALNSAPASGPASRNLARAGDPALYMFTSGTTGHPKPAIITHAKFVFGSAAHAVYSFRASSQDRLYNCLPLYHGTGLIAGVGACLFAGASVVLRPTFSASALIEEANRANANMLIYVGEICRYLMMTPEAPSDHACTLVRAAGNGLRPDIWRPFKARFGLDRIGEFYGASEANGGFLNVFNKDETIGITAATVKLVAFEPETAELVRGVDGFAAPVERYEPGLMLLEVNEKDRFDGYRDAAQSETKLVRDAFAPGDCWFNSGDVIREVDVGFAFDMPHYQFVDRLGETFRWKSQNVSTAEVAETIAGFSQVRLACVFGVAVPGADGKACMAALEVESPEAFDWAEFADFLHRELPSYARPLFVRLTPSLETTGTFKLVKTRLIADGYGASITDPVFAWNMQDRCYEVLDASRRAAIAAGRAGY